MAIEHCFSCGRWVEDDEAVYAGQVYCEDCAQEDFEW